MDKRPKVLLIAEAANPEWVSVPLVGWSLAHALREVADVHLVTQIRNRDAILRFGYEEGTDFTAIDSEALARPMWKIGDILTMGKGKGWTALQAVSALTYPYFERLVWRKFGAEIRNGTYDIVHRVTPLSPTIQSHLAAKCEKAGVPFVVGPLNGGVPWPPAFDAERRREKEWLSYVRGAYKLLPGRKSTLASRAIIVGSRHTQSEIPDAYQHKCIYIPENAVDPDRFSKVTDYSARPVRACFIGRMVPYKGPDMLLEAALSLLKEGKLHIDLIGDGPMLEGLKAFAAEENVASAISFHGWLAHDRVQEVAAGCNILSFPSVREFGGGVVLEAMAMGLVPLIVDYAGPGELVSAEFGRKVPLGDRTEIVAAFGKALANMVDTPETHSALGLSGRDRISSHFTWARKAEQVRDVYEWALGKRAGKPAPFE